MWNVDGRTKSDDNSSHGLKARWAKNWRPISLLNTVYKIGFGVISSRLKRVLEKLIDLDQTGFISGRYIGDNIRLIYDMSKNMVFELLVSFGIQMVKY